MEPIAVAETAADIDYVRSQFVTLEQLARARTVPIERIAHWAGTVLPRATYALPDGELRYAADWWRLYDDACALGAGAVETRVRTLFERRLRAASAALAWPVDAVEEWECYLAGLYGACLREVTPENVVAKERLVARIARALEAPRRDDAAWRDMLGSDVDALDGLTKPFAACDRARFGRPTSRDRCVTDVRHTYPELFTR